MDFVNLLRTCKLSILNNVFEFSSMFIQMIGMNMKKKVNIKLSLDKNTNSLK